MTVASEVNRSGPYPGNGVATVFDYDFRILAASHLQVIKADAEGVETTLALTTDYTVSGVGDANGQVTVSVAPLTGQTITILRSVPFVQETDLENQGAYYAETVEDALDLAVMRDQQLAEQMERAIKLPASSDDTGGELSGQLAAGILRLADSADAIDTVASISDDVETVAGIAGDVALIADVSEVLSGTASAVRIDEKIFVGDGVTTTWTLDRNPGTSANVLVWIGGAIQDTSDYSVSGTTLTITPAVANSVEIRTLILTLVSANDVYQAVAQATAAAMAAGASEDEAAASASSASASAGSAGASEAAAAGFAAAAENAADEVAAVIYLYLKNDGSQTAIVNGINVAPDAVNRLFIRGPLSLPSGISIRSKNQDDTVNQPLEIISSQLRLTGGPLEIRPTPNTMTKGLDIVQSSPSSGNTGNGEAYFNQISTTFTASRTGSGIDGGSGSALVSGLHIGMACGGGGYNLQSVSSLNVGCVPIAADTSPGDKLAINSGLYIQYNSPGKIYGMSTGVTVDRTGGKTGYSPQVCGFEVDMFLLGAGGSDARIGFNAWSGGTHQAATDDIAYAVMSRGGTIDGAPVAPWKDGLVFLQNDINPALSASGSMIKMPYTTTITNVISAPNITVTGKIIDTPLFKVYGSGSIEIANGDITFDAGDKYVYDRTNNNHQFQIGGNICFLINANNMHPGADNVRNLGAPSIRFGTVYAATGAINTSDERQKQDIRDFTDAELDAWSSVRACAFRFKDATATKGDAARIHYGHIAQEVKAAFAAHGIDTGALALWCEDKVTKVVTKTRIKTRPKMKTVIETEERVELVDGIATLVTKERAVSVAEMQTVPVFDADGNPVMITRDMPLRDADGNIVYKKTPVITGYIENDDETKTPVFATDENGDVVYAVSSKPMIAHDEDGNKLTYQEQRTHSAPVIEEYSEEYSEEIETDDVIYGLRYDGCNAIEAAYQRRENERLSGRIAALEEALSSAKA